MAFNQCSNCNRFYNASKGHDCKAAPTVKKRYVYKWIRPWHVKTAADLKIERKFAKCKSMEMFGRAA